MWSHGLPLSPPEQAGPDLGRPCRRPRAHRAVSPSRSSSWAALTDGGRRGFPGQAPAPIRGEGLPTLVQGAPPVILRVLGAALGAVLVVAAAGSVIGTVVVPRAFTSRLTACADWLLARAVHRPARLGTDTQRRDAVLAGRAAAILLLQLL